MEQKPSVGHIVHWHRGDGACLAAIVTDDGGLDEGLGNVRLSVFDPHRELPVMVSCAPHDEGKSEFTWHWPERA